MDKRLGVALTIVMLLVAYVGYNDGKRAGREEMAIALSDKCNVSVKPMGEVMTPEELEKKRKADKYRADLAVAREQIVARNDSLRGQCPEWPQPRFMSIEAEEIVGRDISERPLHGVPSEYASPEFCLARALSERSAGGPLVVHKKAA